MTKTQALYWSYLIIQLRRRKHWTQERLAELLQSDQATVSRWEHAVAVPRNPVRFQLESLAREAELSTLDEAINLVRSSPFPMILVDMQRIIVAASSTSGFREDADCHDQTPREEAPHLTAFCDCLDQAGFWEQRVARMDYEFITDAERRRAVVTPLTVFGVTYALVQKAW
jgi:transcriptional regulator with XRE-family HTH domain